MKIGRNKPCPCGSGLKYKKCHGNYQRYRSDRLINLAPKKRSVAEERIRTQQQGLGAPIVSFEADGQRFVIAGNRYYYSHKWKTFIDFLGDYLLEKFGREWGQAELQKPPEQRHIILEWQAAAKSQSAAAGHEPGKVVNMTLTGIACCLLGLAYNLYLLEHNVELQERFINRLRNPGNFQGAYYELIVAGVLISAGFDLTLEDEVDDSIKHCEFSAISKRTGRKYWVEAKMRSVQGILHKSALDGVSQSVRDPTTKLTKHLRDSLAKPAQDERLIFLDLNAPFAVVDGQPDWMDQAVKRLDAREKALIADQAAYVFVTNLPFHRYPDDDSTGRQVLVHGLGLDFGKPGYRTLIQWYKNKQDHIDAYDILEGIKRYPNLPSTFDGTLPSDTFEGPARNIKIGQTYFFEGLGENGEGLIGTVTTAMVNEEESKAYVSVQTQDDEHFIIPQEMSEHQLSDYRRHPDVFFGDVLLPGKNTSDPHEFFEWLLGVYMDTSKEQLLELMKDSLDLEQLQELSREELALVFCERHTIALLKMAAPETLRFGTKS